MNLKEIDLNKLQNYAFTVNELAMSPIASSWDKFINLKCLGNESIIPTVQAIPLDKVKQAREEIENLETQIQSYHNDNPMISQSDVLAILDKLIAVN